ncbi:TPA: PrgH/EprH family type III secretion apparatus protein [Salmonella enterica subsp. enterica serovar Saintpaul str. CFSAN004144]|nr:PrgH/EprH family type III secretion apparatus protein [Salmonella enterica subsp. enterica serovar Saintpaul str. CFSAN004144]
MLVAEDNLSDFRSYVIRILSGPLMGCEYSLLDGKLLFIVGNNSVMTNNDSFPVLPNDTIYIPLEQGGINFEITIDNNEPGRGKIQLHEFRETGRHTRYVDFNTPVMVGGLGVAIRASEQVWSTSVLSYPDTGGGRRRKKLNWGYMVLVLLIMAAVIPTVSSLWNTTQYKTVELNALLGDEQHRFKILQGRNHQYYIFARNEQDRIWARQAAVRKGYGDSVEVIDAEAENKRIAKWFDSYYPTLAYYRLHLDNPEIPRFWVSTQRTELNSTLHKDLTESLMMLLPYARTVEIVPVNDDIALSQAEEGLKRRNIPFFRKNIGGDLTFMISGELNDTDILRAREFIKQYNQKWGDRYIQFEIELKADRKQDSSYLYGDYMYEKKSPEVWSFINPQ